jgi:DNA invertase Pin-like site-specific DNA recombinase
MTLPGCPGNDHLRDDIGYGSEDRLRESQHPGPAPESQIDALTADGCVRVFLDHASAKRARRPELDAVLDFLRAGDKLVITKLDRLGRSVQNLLELVGKPAERKSDLRILDQGVDTTTAAGK